MARGVRKSLVGMKFEKLSVKEYKGVDKFRNSLWVCQCSCGRTTIEKGTDLTTGKIISCGVCDNRLAKNPIAIKETIDTSLVGQRFGKLVVNKVYFKKTKNGRKMYAKCTCDCGKKTEVLTTILKRGKTLSCGCLRLETMKNAKFRLSDDFIGRRFGKLVVDSFDENEHKWKCICDCGNIKYSTKGNLLNGGYTSCGKCHNIIKK